jgi:hypothetical protein
LRVPNTSNSYFRFHGNTATAATGGVVYVDSASTNLTLLASSNIVNPYGSSCVLIRDEGLKGLTAVGNLFTGGDSFAGHANFILADRATAQTPTVTIVGNTRTGTETNQMVSVGANLTNAVILLANNSVRAGSVSTSWPWYGANVLTNGQTGVTLGGTLSGNGSGLTNLNLVGSGGSTNITGGGTWTLNAGTWTYAPTFTGLNIQTNGATAHGNASALNFTTGPGLTGTVTSNGASTATLDLQLDNARTNYFAYVNSSNYVWTTYADTLLSNLWLITTINGVNVNTNTLPNR